MNDTSRMPPTAAIQARLVTALALPSRVGHIALLLMATAMAGITAALSLSEPDLPPRTRLALGALAVVGVAWAIFAAWVLARRDVLIGRHRLIAGWMAVSFSAALTASCGAAAWLDRGNAMWPPATGVGATMLVFGAILLRRAYTDVRALLARRDALRAALDAQRVTA